MPKILLITSGDCGHCIEIKALLEERGVMEHFETFDMESEAGISKIGDILLSNPDLIVDAAPQCVTQYDDGTYGPCNIEDIWDVADGIVEMIDDTKPED